ncbi:hypothetical protein N4R57_10785 [Rhodobacteraceae bacterium D3-12]|nr:hypothetical protein N4R57_10785 [Rhodobacteraceae bacterium D3-12]
MNKDEANNHFYKTLCKNIDSIFTRQSKFKVGERGREWSWRWGYWGRALSMYYCATESQHALELFDQVHSSFKAFRDDQLGLTDDLRGKVPFLLGHATCRPKRPRIEVM